MTAGDDRTVRVFRVPSADLPRPPLGSAPAPAPAPAPRPRTRFKCPCAGPRDPRRPPPVAFSGPAVGAGRRQRQFILLSRSASATHGDLTVPGFVAAKNILEPCS